MSVTEKIIWRAVSRVCATCKKPLPNDLIVMENEQSIIKYGSSGARHYCDNCRPAWTVRMRTLSWEIIEFRATLRNFARSRSNRTISDVADEFSRHLRIGTIEPALIHWVKKHTGSEK